MEALGDACGDLEVRLASVHCAPAEGRRNGFTETDYAHLLEW
ncbi:hypothetical protein ACIHCV_27540 [Streptomyces sp. NPDC051956]